MIAVFSFRGKIKIRQCMGEFNMLKTIAFHYKNKIYCALAALFFAVGILGSLPLEGAVLLFGSQELLVRIR